MCCQFQERLGALHMGIHTREWPRWCVSNNQDSFNRAVIKSYKITFEKKNHLKGIQIATRRSEIFHFIKLESSDVHQMGRYLSLGRVKQLVPCPLPTGLGSTSVLNVTGAYTWTPTMRAILSSMICSRWIPGQRALEKKLGFFHDIFVCKVNISTVNCSRATSFIFDCRVDILDKQSEF